MGRPLRLDPEHGIHHVYSRGTRRWTLFIDDLDYQRFMQRLGVVCLRYKVTIHAFCLMGNHFHLIAYCPTGGLAAALRDLKSVYARAHNDRHGFSGPLFESRYGSKLIESYLYLRTLVRYIHRNPLAIEPGATLASYPYSSHRLYLEQTNAAPEWLDASLPLSFFTDMQEYKEFVDMNLPSDDVLARPDGSRHRWGEAKEPTSFATIVLLTASAAKCDVSAIQMRQRNGLLGLVVLLAADVLGHTAAELTDACGFASTNAVYNAKRETRRRLRCDPDLAAVHDAVTARLSVS